MKNFLYTLFILIFMGCGYPKEEGSEKVRTVNIDSMHSYLSTLNLVMPESAGEGLTYTHSVMQTMNEDARDSAFVLYRQFFYEVMMKQNEKLTENPALIKLLSESTGHNIVDEAEYFKKKLNDNGMILLQAEGLFYIDEKDNYLHDAFAPYVSAPVKRLLEIRKQELKEGFSNDAALIISFKDVGERLRNWEKLIEENPDLKLPQEAQGYYNLYLTTLLTGLDNSPAFDYQTNTLVPEVKEAYENYINKYGDTRSGKIIGRYYELIKENNFKKPSNLQPFLREYNIASMEGVEPPTR